MAPTTPFRRTVTLMVAAILGVGVSVVAAPAAQAAVTPAFTADATDAPDAIEAGTLIWGVHENWRRYITGGIADGHIVAEEPATLNGDDTVTWTGGTGDVDLEAGTGSITYHGGMTSQGHKGLGPDGGYALDQTLRDVRVELTSTTTATLSAEVDQPGASGFPEYDGERVDIADLTFEHDDLLAGQVVASGVFTEDGADVYARTNDDYLPGAPVEDVVFGIGTEATEPPPAQSTSVALAASKATACEGESVSFTATASPAIAGSFTFSNHGTALGRAIEAPEGTGSFQTSGLPVGDHAVSVRFEPQDGGYAASSSQPTHLSVATCGSDETATEGSLEWGVKKSFREYVTGGIAHGDITTAKGATQAGSNGVFTFPQAAQGTTWNGSTGSVQYAGQVSFRGHDGVMDVTLANPVVRVTSDSSADLRIPLGASGDLVTFARIDLAGGVKNDLRGDAVRFRSAPVTLTSAGAEFFSYQGSTFYQPGEELDRITFTVGAASDVETAAPPRSDGAAPRQPGPAAPAAAPTDDTAAAGSLAWGISSAFVAYTTCEGTERFGYSHCANGSISTSGVGSGYLFPQATGGDWDVETQTGTVRYSGVVSFQGYGTTMFSVSNPSITVESGSSATLHTGNSASFGSASYPLDLSSASKTEGDNGEVTWSGVSVGGSLTGGPGGGSANSVGFDDLTFTVGEASSEAFGATDDVGDDETHTAAESAPTTSGLEVLTDADRIREGGRIQIRATDFEADDEGVLVVLYDNGADSGPIVLDDSATADESGVVTWSGTLPGDALGDHVITLQGSADAGAEIDILEKKDAVAPASASTDLASGAPGANAGSSAALLPADGMALWEWWVIAASLVAIAGCTTVLAVRQRRAPVAPAAIAA